MELESTTATQQERRFQNRNASDKIVAERSEMLVLFCRVAGLPPFNGEKRAPDVLQQFCELLVDYVAAGHFILYERIAQGRERRLKVRDLAEQVYPRIAATTEAALDFNDKYEGKIDQDRIAELEGDLSKLGEALATRAELEDQLIQQLR